MGRPAMLVPLPHAVDNDQLQNAIRLAESDGAWCIEQKDLTRGASGQRHRPPAAVAARHWREAAAAAKGWAGPTQSFGSPIWSRS